MTLRVTPGQVERLEAFLLDEGYLTVDDRLSDDEVRRRVAEAVAA